MTDWELSDGEKTTAKVAEADLIRDLQQGKVAPSTLCRVVGTENWKGLRSHAPFARAMEEAHSRNQSGAPTTLVASTPVAPVKLDRQRIAMMVAASVGAIGTFLPWVKVPLIGWVSGTDRADGWVSLLFFASTIGIVFFAGRAQPLSRRLGAMASIPPFLAAILAAERIARVEAMVSSYGSAFGVVGKSFGKALMGSMGPAVGLYVIAGAGIAVPLAWLVLGKRNPSR